MDFKAITLSLTNCYLLQIEDGYLLVDCGNERDKQMFLSNINRLDIQLTDIHYLLLTHHHNDHCGLLHFLISANPYLKVIMSKKCAEYLKTGMHCKHLNDRYSSTALRLIIATYSKLDSNWSDSFIPYFTRSEDIIIEADNEAVLPKLGIDGKILLAPGHTEDSISIVTGKSAFVGDAARNMLNFIGTPYQPILIYDLEECYKSWHKLINSGAKEIYQAHGKPFNSEKLRAFMK